jgi:hypothetical protein
MAIMEIVESHHRAEVESPPIGGDGYSSSAVYKKTYDTAGTQDKRYISR